MMRSVLRYAAASVLAIGLLGGTARADALGQDVWGRDVPLGAGRPALVFFSNEKTRKVLREHAFAFAFEQRAADPLVVVHVDLRGVPGFFKGTARKEVKKAHRESVLFMEDYSRDHGVETSRELVDNSLYMVPDYDGAPHASQGMPKGFGAVMAEVRDGAGKVVAQGRFPEDADRLSRALADAGDGRRAAR